MPGTMIRDQLFHLTQEESDITATDISANQTSLWLEGWRWQVPVGIEIVFLPGHTFSIYAKDLATAELTVADKLRILIKDSAQNDAKLILGPVLYTQVTEFQDQDLIKHLDISKPFVVKESEWIVIEVYAAVSLDVSACYWDLTCQRIRQAIF